MGPPGGADPVNPDYDWGTACSCSTDATVETTYRAASTSRESFPQAGGCRSGRRSSVRHHGLDRSAGWTLEPGRGAHHAAPPPLTRCRRVRRGRLAGDDWEQLVDMDVAENLALGERGAGARTSDSTPRTVATRRGCRSGASRRGWGVPRRAPARRPRTVRCGDAGPLPGVETAPSTAGAAWRRTLLGVAGGMGGGPGLRRVGDRHESANPAGRVAPPCGVHPGRRQRAGVPPRRKP